MNSCFVARKPKSVICVIGSLNVGGAERHLVQALPRLDKSRWKPTVYCLTERGALADILEDNGVEVLCSPIPPPGKGASRTRRLFRIAATVYALMKLMRAERPAIAHFFLPAAYILGAPAGLLAGVPVLIMSRRSLNEYQKGHRFSALIERWLHGRMTAVLGNSRRVMGQLQDEEGVSENKLALIYNGIDVALYGESNKRESVRRAIGAERGALLFITVANLIPYKGHADLLEAFGLASRDLPPGWRLLVVGRDDGIQARLVEQADVLGISENVLFLGPRNDVPDLLGCVDVSLLASHQEGFSNSVLEGMAAGLPSIVTDVGGNAEAVTPETGIVVPARDPSAFASAIVRLSKDARLRKCMGQAARQRVARSFSLAACVERYERLYEGLCCGEAAGEIIPAGVVSAGVKETCPVGVRRLPAVERCRDN